MIEKDETFVLAEEAKKYLESIGLLASLNKFFAGEPAVKLISEKFTTFLEEVQKIYQGLQEKKLPKSILARAKFVVDTVKTAKTAYLEDVRMSFLISLKNLFEVIENFVTVDSQIFEPFKDAFENCENPKIMKVLEDICDGIKEGMVQKVRRHMWLPPEVPEEVAEIIMMLSGGNPAMSMEEMERMFGEGESETEE